MIDHRLKQNRRIKYHQSFKDEDDDLTEESDEDNDSLEESNSDNNEDEEDVLSANVFFNTKEAFTRRDDICLNGFEYHSLGDYYL